MKTATVQVAAVYLNCPECNENIENQDGSFLWDITVILNNQTVKCEHCGAMVKLPKVNFEKARKN